MKFFIAMLVFALVSLLGLPALVVAADQPCKCGLACACEEDCRCGDIKPLQLVQLFQRRSSFLSGGSSCANGSCGVQTQATSVYTQAPVPLQTVGAPASAPPQAPTYGASASACASGECGTVGSSSRRVGPVRRFIQNRRGN